MNNRFILGVAGLWLGLTVTAVQPARAQSAYVPLDDVAYVYIDALMARGELRALSALERPYTTGAITDALAAETVRRTTARRPTARVSRDTTLRSALRRAVAKYEYTEPSTAPLRGEVSASLSVIGQTSGQRELMRADTHDPRWYFGGAFRVLMTAGPVVAFARPIVDNRLNSDPDFPGRKDRKIAGRMEDSYIDAQWKYGELFFGRVGRNWGPAPLQGLLLSNAPYTYDHLFGRIGLDRINMSLLLARMETDNTGTGEEVARYFATHRLAARWGWLEAAVAESYLYSGVGRGFEPSFANPFSIYALTWRNERQAGNLLVTGQLAARTPYGLVSAEAMLDDIQVDRCDSICREPASYGVTFTAEGVRVPFAPLLFGSYTRVSSLTYRTPTLAERYAIFDVSLGRAFSDYDEWRIGADVVLFGAPLRPYYAQRRQGEGDYRLAFPAPGNFATQPSIFEGSLTEIRRLAISGGAVVRGEFDVKGDIGFNWVRSTLPGSPPSSFEGRVRVSWNPRFTLATRPIPPVKEPSPPPVPHPEVKPPPVTPTPVVPPPTPPPVVEPAPVTPPPVVVPTRTPPPTPAPRPPVVVVPTPVPPTPAAAASLTNLYSVLNQQGLHATRLRARRNLRPEDVRLVNVETLLDESTTAAFNRAESRRARGRQTAQDAARSNPVVSSVLADAGVAIDRVIALAVSDQGVIVYYRPAPPPVEIPTPVTPPPPAPRPVPPPTPVVPAPVVVAPTPVAPTPRPTPVAPPAEVRVPPPPPPVVDTTLELPIRVIVPTPVPPPIVRPPPPPPVVLAPTPVTPAPVTTTPAAAVSLANLYSVLNQQGLHAARLRARRNLRPEDVTLVNVETLLDESTRAAFNRAEIRRVRGRQSAQNAARNNAVVSSVLADAGVAIDRVVAISVSEAGHVIVYYRPAAVPVEAPTPVAPPPPTVEPTPLPPPAPAVVAPAPVTPAPLTPAPAAAASLTNLYSVLNQQGLHAARLRARRNLRPEDVTLVNVETLLDESTTAAFNQAENRRVRGRQTAQNAARTNPVVAAVLANAGVAIDQVVAIAVNNGAVVVVVYYRSVSAAPAHGVETPPIAPAPEPTPAFTPPVVVAPAPVVPPPVLKPLPPPPPPVVEPTPEVPIRLEVPTPVAPPPPPPVIVAPTPVTPAPVTTAPAAAASLTNLYSVLNQQGLHATRLRARRNLRAEDVTLVNVETLLDESTTAAFNRAETRRVRGRQTAQNAARNSSVISSVLANAGIAIDQVIAIAVSGQGVVVIVYYRPAVTAAPAVAPPPIPPAPEPISVAPAPVVVVPAPEVPPPVLKPLPPPPPPVVEPTPEVPIRLEVPAPVPPPPPAVEVAPAPVAPAPLTPAPAAAASLTNLYSVLNQQGLHAARLRARRNLRPEDVTLVNVETLLDESTRAAFNRAEIRRVRGRQSAQNAARTNPVVTAVLANAGIAIDQVVAIAVSNNVVVVVVYYRSAVTAAPGPEVEPTVVAPTPVPPPPPPAVEPTPIPPAPVVVEPAPIAPAPAAAASLTNLYSVLNQQGLHATRLSRRRTLRPEDVTLVNVETLLDESTRAAFNRAETRRVRGRQSAQNAVRNSSVVSSLLADAGVAIDRVVAISVSEAGHVIVYYRPATAPVEAPTPVAPLPPAVEPAPLPPPAPIPPAPVVVEPAPAPIAPAPTAVASLTNLYSVLNQQGLHAARLRARRNLRPEEVTLVNAGTLLDESTRGAFERAVSRRVRGGQTAQNAARAHPVVSSVLASAGVAIDQVIALAVSDQGVVVVVYHW